MLLDQPCFRNGNNGSDGKTGGKNGSCRVENGEMGTGNDKRGQDKKRIHERDCENCKARRQTSECKAMLVWTHEKDKKRLHGKTMMKMAVPDRRKRGRPRRRQMELFFFLLFLFAIFILHSRESELYRYTLDGKSALAWELPFSRFLWATCLPHKGGASR